MRAQCSLQHSAWLFLSSSASANPYGQTSIGTSNNGISQGTQFNSTLLAQGPIDSTSHSPHPKQTLFAAQDLHLPSNTCCQQTKRAPSSDRNHGPLFRELLPRIGHLGSTSSVSRRLQTFSPQNDAPRPIHSQLHPVSGPSSSSSARGQHIGGLGRAGRGVGEPGPASGAASLAAPPPAAPDGAAALRSRTSPAPRLRHPRLRNPRGSEGGTVTARGKRRK